MNLDEMLGPLLLSDDATFQPVSELPDVLRAKLPAGGQVLTRVGGRGPSTVFDAASVELIELFRAPSRIVDALLVLGARGRGEPEAMLESAYPLLSALAHDGFLRPVRREGRAAARLPGMVVAGLTVVQRLQQSEDTELFQAQTEAGQLRVLKIARPEYATEMRETIAREARVLEHLAGAGVPLLYSAGTDEACPFLVMSWCEGVTVDRAASELGPPTDEAAVAARAALALRVVEAYARLHARGCLHGDVHPGNVLVDARGEITLVDFGYGSVLGDLTVTPRAGMPMYWEPELARAHLAGTSAPPTTASGEQYAVGAMVYEILTGESYLDFELEPRALSQQIVDVGPASFEARGAVGAGAWEPVVRRALAKSPGARFASLAEFAHALDGAATQRLDTQPALTTQPSLAVRLVSEVLGRLTAPRSALARLVTGSPPTHSVMHGAAGTAYALYRMALAREDAGLAAAAEAWAAASRTAAPRETAFLSETRDLDEARVGRVSPYFAEPGVHLTSALIARALGDDVGEKAAVHAFVAGIEPAVGTASAVDLVGGWAGVVSGCAALLSGSEHPDVRVTGARAHARLWDAIGSRMPGRAGEPLSDLTFAHGWCGLLYATLRWARSTGQDVPPHALACLEVLSERTLRIGRGVVAGDVAGEGPSPSPMTASWCRGSAGQVSLWSLAHRMFGEPRWAALAERLGWNAWEWSAGSSSLCCGDVGRAYALLEVARLTGDARWRSRARLLGVRALERQAGLDEAPDSLFRGQAGLAMLWVDLERPGDARVPLLEDGD